MYILYIVDDRDSGDKTTAAVAALDNKFTLKRSDR